MRGTCPPPKLAAKAESLKKYKEKPVVVYCENGFASGARGAHVARRRLQPRS